MNVAKCVALALAGLIVSFHSSLAADFTPELKALIAAAQKEGELRLTFGEGSAGGEAGAVRFEKGLNEMFGTNIKLVFTPGPSMPAMASQITTLNAAKQPSPSDVYVGWSRHYPALYKRKVLQSFEWTKFLPGRITPDMVELDGAAVKFATSIPGVYYNTKLSPYKPQRLSDFLKPEWKGRISTTPYSAGFDILAGKDIFGPQKALDYAKQLSPQIAGLTRCDENERLASGEFLAMVMDCGDLGLDAIIKKGAPIAHFTPKDYPTMSYYYLSVPKNAPNAAAGILFTVYASLPEGQKIIRDSWGGDMNLYPEAKMHQTAQAVEAEIGQKLHSIDLVWQRGNDEGRKTHGEINKILAVKK